MPRRRARARRALALGAALAAAAVALVLAPAAAVAAPGATTAAPVAGAQPRRVTPALPALLALQQARFTDGQPTSYAAFGRAVALDGDTALVGADGKSVAGLAYAGAVYVYVRAGGIWSLQAQLTCPEAAAGDGFGGAVALDGDTALVGASGHGLPGAGRAGAAYVFVRAAGAWSLQAQLNGAGAATDDWAGTSVALAGDVAVVGAPGRTVGGNHYAGAAWVFRRSGTAWLQEAELTPAGGAAGDEFGAAVALGGDTVLAGAPDRAVNGATQAGQAYVFTRSGGSWYLEAQLGAPDPAARAGFGAALAFEGGTALVGAGGASPQGEAAAGAAYIFERSGSNWLLAAQLTDPGSTPGDWFGASVALDGDEAVVGAWGTTVSGRLEAGAAYVFSRSPAGWSRRCAVTAATPATNDTFGWAVAVDGQATLAGAPGDTVSGHAGAGAALMHKLVTAPSLTLAAAPRVTKAGRRVALSGAVTNAVAGADTVRVWRRQGSRMTLLTTVSTSAAGAYRVSVPVKTPGSWIFVAGYDAAGQTFRSPAVTVTVEKKKKPPKHT